MKIKNNYNIKSIFVFLILIIFLPKYYTNTYNITIPDDGYKLNEINEYIQILSLKYNNINIFLNVDVFSDEIRGKVIFQIPENTNVSLIGKPTIITYPETTFYFNIEFNEYNNQTFTIENITFKNFISERPDLTTLFFITAMHPNFNMYIKNCNFDVSNSSIVTYDIRYQLLHDEYQIIIDSCYFKLVLN